jgi:hypothetical protein
LPRPGAIWLMPAPNVYREQRWAILSHRAKGDTKLAGT